MACTSEAAIAVYLGGWVLSVTLLAVLCLMVEVVVGSAHTVSN